MLSGILSLKYNHYRVWKQFVYFKTVVWNWDLERNNRNRNLTELTVYHNRTYSSQEAYSISLFFRELRLFWYLIDLCLPCQLPTVALVHASFFYEATLIEIGVYLFYLLDVFRHKRHSSELLPNQWSQVKIKWFPGSYGYTHQYTKECKHLHITVSNRARGIQKKPVEHVKKHSY